MIKLLAHRCNDGRDLDPKYGAEVDVWCHGGELILSHDYPNSEQPHLFMAFKKYPYLAVNAKSSGLEIIKDTVLGRTNYFIFDCAVPEAIKLSELGLRVFTRESEYEVVPTKWPRVAGIWMDQFYSDWIQEDDINDNLTNYVEVAIVSPDLHGRDPRPFWRELKEMDLNGEIFLCTKFPEEAEEFFNADCVE